MIKKSILAKSLSCVFTAAIVVGAFSYAQERFSPRPVDFSAFKNATANIQFLSAKKSESEHVLESENVTADIINVIEKEVKGKIKKTRYVVAKSFPKKIEIKTIVRERLAEEVSELEINNKELIKLYRFEMESRQYDIFENTLIAKTMSNNDELVAFDYSDDQAEKPEKTFLENDIKEDIVATAQASTIAPEEMKEEGKDLAVVSVANDDLVVFDYSNKQEEKSKKIFDAPISNTVKEAIAREVHKDGFVTVVDTQRTQKERVAEKNNKVMEDEDSLVFDYSKTIAAAPVKNNLIKDAESQAFTGSVSQDDVTAVEFVIRAKEINLNTQKVRQAFRYEFVPDYDRSERQDDQTTGEIKLGYSLSGEMNTQTGVIQSQGLIPTRVELNLIDKGINVPLINEEGIQKFLAKKSLDIVGNLLMVAVDPSINDVEIDSDYQAKLFFTSNFKLQEAQDKAAYVLFLGVKSGNILLKYLLNNKESAQKIVYVGEGEMYFEDPGFVEAERELYTFSTRSLLGKIVKELNIDGDLVSFYGTKTTSKKKALNAYEMKIPELVENTRKYLEFKHLDSSLFVGTNRETEIEIPGQDFINKVLQTNDLSIIGERCMVQVNLVKDLRNIKASGKNKVGEMFVETSFLDRDGSFSRDNSELVEKIFVTGDMEGMLSVRLDYTDGSTEFLKTFCSEGSYLIEQL